MDCANCAAVLRGEGGPGSLEPHELPEACQRGRCTEPEPEGLGVVRLDPINALVVGFDTSCRALTPVLALVCDDLSWHPDKALLAAQLRLLTDAFGPLTQPVEGRE